MTTATIARKPPVFTPAQQVKVDRMITAYTGMRINVSQDKGYITGIIDTLKPAYWGGGKLVFEVELLCGAVQVRKTFFLSTFNSAR